MDKLYLIFEVLAPLIEVIFSQAYSKSNTFIEVPRKRGVQLKTINWGTFLGNPNSASLVAQSH